MCGNAVRCVAKYLFDNGIVPAKRMRVETISGVRELALTTRGGVVSSVRVNMGPAEPHEQDTVTAAGYAAACLTIGNPHAVIFQDTMGALDIQTIGPLFEHHSAFPDRINAEFVKALDRNHLEMRIWERGNGETQGCGSGACAAAAAAVLNGCCDKDTDIKVKMIAGDVIVRVTDDAVFLTGGCEKIFEGIVEI
jgi:carbamoyl-phosphate synthase large subunit